MYRDIKKGVSETVKIMGHPFYTEDINGDTPHNYRERNFTPILGGTEKVTQGKYVHREFSFTTTVYFPTGRPDAHDKIFKEIMSKPVTVVSPYMGGKFKALVTIQKNFPENSVNLMDLDVKIVEIPGQESNIPGEKSFKVPEVYKVPVKTKKGNGKTNDKSSNKSDNCESLFKNCNKKLSRSSKKSDCVKKLQTFLQAHGYYLKSGKHTLKLDGYYGPYTQSAVKSIQKAYKLKPTGAWDKQTIAYFKKECETKSKNKKNKSANKKNKSKTKK